MSQDKVDFEKFARYVHSEEFQVSLNAAANYFIQIADKICQAFANVKIPPELIEAIEEIGKELEVEE